jgi:hypothetical protein
METNLPSLPDNGSVIIVSSEHGLVDSVLIDKQFHSPLLNDVEGVSLERINPYKQALSTDNWNSASEIKNFATPGEPNSQRRVAQSSDRHLLVDPPVFFPGSFGGISRPNFTIISYSEGFAGEVGYLNIYDESGKKVRELVNASLLGTEGYYKWDGTDDEGRVLAAGRYLVLFRTVGTNGVRHAVATLVLATGY